MFSNLPTSQEHLDVVEAELERVGKTLPMGHFKRRFQMDTDEVVAAIFKLEEQGRVELTVSTGVRTIMVTLNERTEEQ